MAKRLSTGLVCVIALFVFPAAVRAELIYGVTSTNLLLSFDSATPGTAVSFP